MSNSKRTGKKNATRSQPQTEPQEFMEIDNSPVPGITLRCILRGHTGAIGRIAWSPDGQRLASPSKDNTIQIWSMEGQECLAVLEGHEAQVSSVAWSPNGQMLASGSGDKAIRLWNTESGEPIDVLKGHESRINSVDWSPDGLRLASGSDDRTVCLWNTETRELLAVLEGHEAQVSSVAWSPDGQMLASGSWDKEVRLWNPVTGTSYVILRGHTKTIYSVTWSPNQHMLASGGEDNTIRFWDARSGQLTGVLEGHTRYAKCLSFSSDGALLASKAGDGIHLWRTGIWEMLAVLKETETPDYFPGLSFHPSLPCLATLGESDRAIRIWDLDMDVLLGGHATAESVSYTTAKIVLVGDSGVGKTALGWRLAHGEFKEHASTHAQQFWIINELYSKRSDGTECEAVLWDLAGQHVYRPIHAIFLDDVDLALVVFDPTNRQEPLKGVEFWLAQLSGKQKLPATVLVGARADRGESVLSWQELDQFCQRHGISGGYISTSAMTGTGLEELLDIIKSQIPWEQKTATVTTVTFKRVKDYILSLKENPDRTDVLIRSSELRRQLQDTDPEQQFTDAVMITAAKQLETHGYITILRGSSNEESLLLAPELLVSLASSIVLQADKHPRELGALSETELLRGGYPFQELTNLEPAEQQILLDAALARFLSHNICFRETLGPEALLIFPGLIKQKRPLLDEVDTVDDVSYIVRGRVENVYAALVVLLGYTQTFTRVNQWQNQAQYEMGRDEVCGFRLIEEREGEIEMVLYYSPAMPDFGRKMFQGLFEMFLYQRDVEVTRFQPVLCPYSHPQERATVIKRLREAKAFLFCEECGTKILLPEIEKPLSLGAKDERLLRREEAMVRLRSEYETNLVRLKSYRRDRAAPRCYISHTPAQAIWAERLIQDLRDAGVYILLDRERLEARDVIALVCAPEYRLDWQRATGAVGADAELIRARLTESGEQWPSTIPLLLDGDPSTSVPPELHARVYCDFRNPTRYVLSLFELMLTLYAIPLNHPAFEPLREAMQQQWKEAFPPDEAIG